MCVAYNLGYRAALKYVVEKYCDEHGRFRGTAVVEYFGGAEDKGKAVAQNWMMDGMITFAPTERKKGEGTDVEWDEMVYELTGHGKMWIGYKTRRAERSVNRTDDAVLTFKPFARGLNGYVH